MPIFCQWASFRDRHRLKILLEPIAGWKVCIRLSFTVYYSCLCVHAKSQYFEMSRQGGVYFPFIFRAYFLILRRNYMPTIVVVHYENQSIDTKNGTVADDTHRLILVVLFCCFALIVWDNGKLSLFITLYLLSINWQKTIPEKYFPLLTWHQRSSMKMCVCVYIYIPL